MIEGFGAQGERFFGIDLCVSRGLVRVLGSDLGLKMRPKSVQNVSWSHLGGLGRVPGVPKVPFG